MRQTRRRFMRNMAAAGGGAMLAPLAFISCSRAAGFDVLIRGGRLADGLGSPLRDADVGILGDRIAAVGDLAGAAARLEIDARGLIVAPGFIDIHSHSDEGLTTNPRAESKIRQGVTLDVGGNCGDSPFPEKKPGVGQVRDVGECMNFAEFVARGAPARFALNAALFVGHGTIRSLVLGSAARAPDGHELQTMRALLEAALQQGAVGLSSGLEYMPGGYAAAEELVELCRTVARCGGVYATHLRSEDERLVEAVDEALEIARASGVSLQISHLKAAGEANWPKTAAVVERIEKARAQGLDVHCDRYPYLAYSTGLSIFFPGWALEGGRAGFLARLRDAPTRRKMQRETLSKVKANGGWETVMIAAVRAPQNGSLVGRRMDEIARAAGKDPYEAACELLLSEGGAVSIVGFGMSEADTDRIIALPYVMIASDGYAMSAEQARRGGQPHPRSFGTFPRALREYVLGKKIVTMEEMIRKMTSMPADKLGFKERGRIRGGAHADIVVFDPDRIADKATYIEPWQYPEGIEHVLVGGSAVILRGRQTDALPGTWLKRAAAS